jgi:hypothetical protein
LFACAAFGLTQNLTTEAATIFSHPSDFEPRFQTGGTIPAAGPYSPGPSTTAVSLRIGFQSNFQITSAFFFQMPALAPGETFGGASFAVGELPDSATTAVTPNHNADLVGLGFTNVDPPANSAAEGQSYFYLGEGALDFGAGRQLIQNNFLVPSSFIPNGGTASIKTSDAGGEASLLGYVNNLYANPSFVPGSSYMILRLNPDTMGDTGTKRYTVGSGENLDPTLRPTLTLTVVPEPSAIALSLLGGLGFFLLRFRRKAV